MKRVLITGKTGYIAVSLYNCLKGFPEEYAVETITLRGESWRAEDFSGYDAVVHCAGLAHSRETVENAHLYYEINRDLTVAVAKKAKADGVRQFVFLSSLSVYGMDEGVITPETAPQPKSAYGKSKLEAERALRAMESEEFRVAILRPPMVYGSGCKGNYQMLAKLARRLPAIPSYVNQRSAVSIARLCECIRTVIDDCAGGIFVPQDTAYLCTCAEIRRLAAENGRRPPVTGLLNFGPALLRRFTAKGRKAFGNLTYNEGMMKRALIAASVASHVEQFCMNDAALLRERGFQVELACNYESGSASSREKVNAFLERLDAEGYGHTQIDFDRGASHFGNHLRAYKQLRRLIEQRNYDLIHCHSPIGGAICRAAARGARKHGTRVLYTAHGFHFFTGAPVKNWLLYYPVEKLCARWTDVLITINREDYERAKKKMPARRVEYIPGVGIDLTRFRPGRFSAEELGETRASLGVAEGEKLLLSVGELNRNKDHETVIRALAELDDPRVKYVVCGCGALENELRLLIRRLGLEDRVSLLGYRTDVDRLYASADLFVFPSHREGLPVALMEALASGLPAVCTRIRGNVELTEARAWFPVGDVSACAEKIREYLSGDNGEEVERNLERLRAFDADVVRERMKQIYEACTREGEKP